MGNNPNGHRATLRPWGPDNPPPRSPGAPRKRALSGAYDAVLRQPLPAEFRAALLRANIRLPKNASWSDAIALSMARAALKANVLAAKELREGAEGRASMRIEMSRDDPAPQFVIAYAGPVPGMKTIDATPEKIIEAVTDDDSDENPKE
jgi:hypothetical protein